MMSGDARKSGTEGGRKLSPQEAEDARIADEIIADVAAHPDDFGIAEDPDAPGPLPRPEHHVGVPGAPATNPPETFTVPSSTVLAGLLGRYGATGMIVLAAVIIVAILIANLG
jgi:hypothetical protein